MSCEGAQATAAAPPWVSAERGGGRPGWLHGIPCMVTAGGALLCRLGVGGAHQGVVAEARAGIASGARRDGAWLERSRALRSARNWEKIRAPQASEAARSPRAPLSRLSQMFSVIAAAFVKLPIRAGSVPVNCGSQTAELESHVRSLGDPRHRIHSSESGRRISVRTLFCAKDRDVRASKPDVWT